jgi:hypothetical protein
LDNDEWEHPGDLEVDNENSAWDDWDERCYGTKDSKTHPTEYPEFFSMELLRGLLPKAVSELEASSLVCKLFKTGGMNVFLN